MAVSKNRRKNGKKAPRKSAATHRQDHQGVAGLKAMEQLMASLQQALAAPGFGSEAASASLAAAQDLVYEAWEASTQKQRVTLAKRALQTSELCADAWLVLAEEAAGTAVAQRDYLEKAVAAGQTAIRQTVGADAF